MAGLLWDEWLPGQVKAVVAGALPGGVDDARRLAVWLAAVHDVGKATPAFACQVDSLADRMRAAGLDMPSFRGFPDRKLAPHGLAGQILVQQWLMERCGWSRSAALQLAVVVGGHHGVPPAYPDIRELNVHPELLRTPGCEPAWRDVQFEFLDACADSCGVADRLPAWREVKLPRPAQVIVAGLVIVADWIASNDALFPYFPHAEGQNDEERVEAAWKGLALPRQWRAVEPPEDPAALFSSRFVLPAGASVRPVQRCAVELARAMSVPGLMVIEAPMGEGKTEAALAVAEIFAARSGAGGCLVALPTMATSNAMFRRLRDWLDRVPDGGNKRGVRSVVLAHSKAALNEDFAEMMRAGRRLSAVDLDGGGDEWRHRGDASRVSAELVAHQWLRGKKKALLASFGVGTIDQLLFMGLKSRHLAMRHLALAGKVVIIDEAHAYDTYMNSYLDRVLSWLGAYRVPVIVLSATLPAGRRRELAEAYAGNGADLGEVAAADRYPLLTAVEPGGPARLREVEPSGRRTVVRLERLDDDLGALVDRLEGELAGGGCALVVRNTVGRVLETAAALRARFGAAEVTVAHSRFLDLDRVANDADLLNRFGPPGEYGAERPVRHIVVASQVAEQSLDIDFDLLVTDLCPVDLLLQRMGRLHRHQRGEGQCERPERVRSARCLVTGADWRAVPVEPADGSRRVYGLHPLLRSAAVLEPYLSDAAEGGRIVQLPEDISPLVQAAYGLEPQGPPEWQDAMARALEQHEDVQERQRDKAEAFQLNQVGRPGGSLVGWVDAGAGDADDTRRGRAQVRDSRESVEVLVVQRRADGTLATMPWLSEGRGGRELPTETAPDPKDARIMAACGLRLPFVYSIPDVLDRAIEELEAECVVAWQSKECHWLAGELILILDENCQTRLAGYDLSYSQSNGLEVVRAE